MSPIISNSSLFIWGCPFCFIFIYIFFGAEVFEVYQTLPESELTIPIRTPKILLAFCLFFDYNFLFYSIRRFRQKTLFQSFPCLFSSKNRFFHTENPKKLSTVSTGFSTDKPLFYGFFNCFSKKTLQKNTVLRRLFRILWKSPVENSFIC